MPPPGEMFDRHRLMTLVDALVCSECGRSYPGGDGPTTCRAHDGGAPLEVHYDEDHVASAMSEVTSAIGESLWQFAPILPTGTERVVLGAGGTPLLDAPTLSASLGVSLRLKDETGNPTGSIKDRASAVLVSRAASSDEVVSCASTGNQAASVAAYAARAGLDCRIFVPGDVPEGKAVQPLVSGASVYAVDGSYDDAFDVCRRTSAERGWYDCSAAVNPYGVEGLRTVGLEIATATAGDVPDWVVVPMGNGCGLSATWKGLSECYRYGTIERTPRLLGVQAEGASAIHDRFTGATGATGASETSNPSEASGSREESTGTMADSIDVGTPHNAARACRAIEESDGATVAVPDDAILAAERSIGHAEGVYVEPASAATVAGLEAALEAGIVERGADVVCLVTGSGLKDTESARTITDDVVRVPADPSAIPPS